MHVVVLRLPDSWSNWNLEMLVFEERRKPEYPEKNLSQQGKEPTTNFKVNVDRTQVGYCSVKNIVFNLL